MKLLHGIWRQIWLTVVVALVMLALYSSLGRQLVPLLENYQPDIEQWLTETIGQPVQIGELQGSWTGVSPVIKIKNLSVGGEQGINFELLEADIALGSSLFYRLPIFNSIRIEGSQGSFTQLDDTHWQLASDWIVNIPTQIESPKKTPAWPQWLALQKDIRLNSLELKLTRLHQEEETFQLSQVRWRSLGQQHELKADLQLGQETLTSIRLQASLVGDLWPLQAQNGRVYLELEEQDWSQWFTLDENVPVAVHELTGSMQGWLSVNKGSLESVYLKADIKGLKLRREQQDFSLDEGQIVLAGAHYGDDWYLQLRPHFKQELPFEQISVSQVKVGAQNVWQMHVPELDVSAAQYLLEKYQLLPEKIAHFIDGTAPQGQAEDIRFTALLDKNTKKFKFDLQAQVNDLHSTAFSGIPALHGANVKLRIQKLAGLVEFEDTSLQLHLSDLYTPSWQLEQLTGRFRWLIHADYGQLLLEDTHARIKENEASWPVSANLQILLPKDPDEIEPSLSLLLGVDEGPVSLQSQLVPNLVGSEVQEWLNQSLQSGQVKDAVFALQMSLDKDRNSVDNDFSTQLYLGFEDAELSYLSEWPTVKDLNGDFYFNSPNMDVRIEQGQTLGGSLKPNSGHARLRPLKQGMLLEVAAGIRGDSSEGLAYFTQTPLREVVNNAFDEWKLEGEHETDLLLRINLGVEEADGMPEVWLSSYFANNHLFLSDLKLDFEELSGALHYSSLSGLSSKELKGKTLGGDFLGNISSKIAADNQLAITLTGQGAAQWQKIRQWQPLFVLEPINGSLSYNANLHVAGGQTRLSLSSDLQGSGVELPAPFAKEKAEHSNLKVDVLAGKKQTFEVVYGQDLHASFVLSDAEVERGQVMLGGAQSKLPANKGVEVRGHLPEVILEDWWRAWQRLNGDTQLTAAEESKAASVLHLIALDADAVDAWGVPLGKTKIQAKYENNWQISLESPVAKGDIQYRSTHHPVTAQLDYLRLPKDEVAAEEQEAEVIVDPWNEIDPQDLPEIDLFIARLQLGEQKYGRWQLESRTIDQGLQIKVLDSDVFGEQLTGMVQWLKIDQKHQTNIIDMRLKGTHIEQLQKGFQQPVLIESEQVSGHFNASWPYSPLGYRAKDISGTGDILLKKGRLITDSAGAVKAFGILNVNSLSRRLKLDFSDLYKSGLAFDSIKGSMKVEEGVLTLTDTITVEGPGGKFIVTGNTSLLDQELDMRVAVVLPVSTNLPLVAVLAGLAPPVAASIFITERLIGDELSRFTTANYDLLGTWQEPEMTIRGAFNKDGSEKRGLKKFFGR